MTGMPNISVVILSHRRPDSLRRVLRELARLERTDMEIIVVDNASPEDIAGVVRAHGEGIALLRLETNIGVAGWNHGFSVARGAYVVLLDDDSYPDPGAIDRGLRLMETDPRIGVVAGQIIHPEGGSSENGERFRRLARLGPDDFQFIGCGAIVRTELLHRIGGFDESLFLYWHETHFGLKTLAAGYRIVMAPEVIFYHLQERTGRTSHRRIYFEVRNMLWIFGTSLTGVRARMRLLRLLAHYCRAIRGPRDARAYLRAIRDGIRPADGYLRVAIDAQAQEFVLHRLSAVSRMKS